MSQICSSEMCKRSSCALCHCCRQNLCLPHLKEHQDLLASQLNPLVDQINVLGERLKAITIENVTGNVRQKLQQWRTECHHEIDRIFKQKCNELDRRVTEKLNKQQDEIGRIQSKMTELTREQDITQHDLDFLLSRIRALEQEISTIEQTSFNVRSQSLNIDDSWVIIEESRKHRLGLSSLSSAQKTVKYIDEKWFSAASNDSFLLLYRDSELCLIDRTLTKVRTDGWKYDDIYSMCWSSVIDRFIIVTSHNIFILDQNNLSTEKIPINQKQRWFCCTCSNNSLFLSTYETGSSIFEYNLLSLSQAIKHWRTPDTCKLDELIHDMKYNNETLALLIGNKLNGTICMELKNSTTFTRLWSLQLNIENIDKTAFCCCSINENDWLVADHANSRLLFINGDEKTQTTCSYNPAPYCPIMFGPDVLTILTSESVIFHKF